jgi:hypothetical protein
MCTLAISSAGSTRIFSASNGSFPVNPTFVQQSSPAVAGVQLITYGPGSVGYTPVGGTLIVGVFGFTGSTFTVSAGVSGSVVELLVSVPSVKSGPGGVRVRIRFLPLLSCLQEGLSQPATALGGQYAYYMLRVSGAYPGDLVLSLTALAGTVQAYGARWQNPARNIGFRPSATSFTYASSGQSSGGVVLTVPAADVLACTAFQVGS